LGTIAICAIFKNEGPYIKEWLQYHKNLGVDKIVLYNNNSSDDSLDQIRDSAVIDDVAVIDWPAAPGQLLAYNHFCANFAKSFDWVAFIDLDEYLHPLEANSLPEILDNLEGHAAVLVNWLVFGASGFEISPSGLVIGNYTKRMPVEAEINRHVKTIVRGNAVKQAGVNPHVFVIDGTACNAEGVLISNEPLQTRPCHTKLVINHYHTKSRQAWLQKLSRGRATTTKIEHRYPVEIFDRIEKVAGIHDHRIARFLPGLLNPPSSSSLLTSGEAKVRRSG
jgi:hypothetical protein